MFKTVLVTLMALLASSSAAPYVYGSPYYASYPYGVPAVTAAAYSAPPLASAYTAPAFAAAAPVAEAALPAAAYPGVSPYSLPGLAAYTYGSGYSVQELGALVAQPSAPLVLGSPYAYTSADYVYGR